MRFSVILLKFVGTFQLAIPDIDLDAAAAA